MWALRVLSGKQAGQVFVLREGKNRIGRSETSDFRLQENGVSKDHMEITVMGEKVLISDLNSANGSFLNGVRIRGGVLRLGDKLGVATILCDLVHARPRSQPQNLLQQGASQTPAIYGQHSQGHLPAPVPVPSHLPTPSMNQSMMPVPMSQMPAQGIYNTQAPPPAPSVAHIDIRTPQQKVDDYVNKNLLPPFLNATEQFEFRTILLLLLGFYVVAVTALSVIPMKQITGDSIANESRRRATTVARTTARINEKVISRGDISNFSVESALREEGVEDAYVLSREGRILAPPERVGMAPKEAGILRDAIQKAGTHEISDTSNGRVLVGTPILAYDSELQQNVAKAYSVVIYNPGSLAFDDGRVFGLFVQTLTLALMVGGIMYFLIYRLIQHPFIKLNEELDKAIRENRDQAQIKIQLPVLHHLITNINSLLARANTGHGAGGMTTGDGVRDHEYVNLVQLIGYPAAAISHTGQILKVNSNFEALIGVSASSLEGRQVDSLSDQSLQGSVKFLMEQAKAMSAQVATHTLEFSGHPFVMNCQALSKSSGDVDCYIVSIKPPESAEGQVA
jgi:hypothetical protein